MTEYCIASDEGVIEEGFYSFDEACERQLELGDGEVMDRTLYDDFGNWIEDEQE